MFTVKKTEDITDVKIEETSSFLDNLPKEKLEHFYFKPDTDKNYCPKVSFAMAHDNKNIILKFFVEEEYILAAAVNDNEMVCRDSCVEFFVIPGEKLENYYNFEFNCIGACLLYRGRDRKNREIISPEDINTIKRYPSLGQRPFAQKQGDFKWDIIIVIPVTIFKQEALDSLSGREFKANFYKCGDKLTKPHWISWHKQEIDHPDFHRPEFFQKILFE